jgi:hypothetical protein
MMQDVYAGLTKIEEKRKTWRLAFLEGFATFCGALLVT